jgi:plastocyanin
MKLMGFSLVIMLLVAVLSVSFLYIKGNNNPSSSDAQNTVLETAVNTEDLIVPPQVPTDIVTVDSAMLNTDGFLVVRQMEGDKLSQVVEMSKPLNKGTHEGITIPLGSADIGDSELIVMIYEDYENDGIFNDLDMPAINEDGYMTARFVKTGKPLPESITEDSSSMPAHTMAGGKEMVKVRYTDKGFIPEKIEVPMNSTVEFTNESSMVMWVASSKHPSHQDLPTFDQFRPFKKGAKYRYLFDKKGIWEYHDHISPSLGGVITVK